MRIPNLFRRAILMLILGVFTSLAISAEEMSIKEPSNDEALLRRQFRVLHERVANGDQQAEKVLRAWRRRGVGNEDLYVNVAAAEKKIANGNNDPALLGKVGGAYLLGQGGVEIDSQKARALLEPASAAGDALASHNLATIYSEGIGEPKDVFKAREYYLLSAEQGRAEGFAHVGNIERDAKNIKGAIEFYIKAGEKGDSAGFKKAADFLLKKNAPVEDRKRGLACLERAAAMGDYRAAYEAGGIYFDGEPGIAPDRSLAARYFSQTLESKWEHRVHEFFYPANPRERELAKKPQRDAALNEMTAKRKQDTSTEVFLSKLNRTHGETLKVRAARAAQLTPGQPKSQPAK
jgi:hypothetical protein